MKNPQRNPFSNSIFKVSGASLFTTVMIIFLGFFLNSIFGEKAGESQLNMLIFRSAVTLVTMTFGILAFRSYNDSRLKELLYDDGKKTGIIISVLFILAGGALCILMNAGLAYIAAKTGQDIHSAYPPLEKSTGILIAVLLTSAVLPAVFEEIVFRGCMYSFISDQDENIAVVVSAAMFSLIHQGVFQMIFAFFCGLVLGYSRRLSGRLWVPVIIHLINNSAAIILLMR